VIADVPARTVAAPGFRPSFRKCASIYRYMPYMVEHGDIYTFEGIEDIRHVLGPGTDEFLATTTTIGFKPDGLVRRTVGAALAILEEDGFRPVEPSQWLCAMKGPSVISRRRPSHLRTRLGAASSFLNLVHTPDHASGFVKELGMLFAPLEQRSLLEEAHSVDAKERLQGLKCAVATKRPITQDSCYLQSMCERALAGRLMHLNEILRLVDVLWVPVSVWDRIVISAASTEQYLTEEVAATHSCSGESIS
jgi:hypothetical protein